MVERRRTRHECAVAHVALKASYVTCKRGQGIKDGLIDVKTSAWNQGNNCKLPEPDARFTQERSGGSSQRRGEDR